MQRTRVIRRRTRANEFFRKYNNFTHHIDSSKLIFIEFYNSRLNQTAGCYTTLIAASKIWEDYISILGSAERNHKRKKLNDGGSDEQSMDEWEVIIHARE